MLEIPGIFGELMVDAVLEPMYDETRGPEGPEALT